MYRAKSRHALRLTEQRMKTIRRIHKAGPDGEPEVLATDVALLIEWEVLEIFRDESRAFKSRVRLSRFGERIAATLAYQIEGGD